MESEHHFHEIVMFYASDDKSYSAMCPAGVLGISSDGDDGRIFLGLKFSIPGFFWVRKFGLGSLI